MTHTITYSAFNHSQDIDPQPRTETRADFIARLTTHRVAPKKLRHDAYGFAEYAPGTKRRDENVLRIHGTAFDFDHLTEAQHAEVRNTLQAAGLGYVLYSTYSHAPPVYKFRVVLWFSRPVERREYRPLMSHLARKYKFAADETCFNESRIFFFPSHPDAELPVLAEVHVGADVDVDAEVAVAGRVAARPTPRPRPAPNSDTVIPRMSLRELRAQLQALASDPSRPWITRLLKGEPLCGPTETGWNDTVHKAVGFVVFKFAALTDEQVLDLFAPSMDAMTAIDEAGGIDWLDEAERQLARARVRKENEDALSERPGLTTAAGDVIDGMELLRRTQRGELINSGYNASLFLRHHPTLKGHFRYNEFTMQIEVAGEPWLGLGGAWRPVKDSDYVAVKNWLEASSGLMVRTTEVVEQITLVSQDHVHNPVREYLNGLVWDGTPRVDTLFPEVFGSRDTAYERAVARRFLISAVARALNPGCKVDNMLILEGRQGMFKSTALRELANGYFSDTQFDLNSKDAYLALQTCWIYEFQEIDRLKKHEAAEVKMFLSSNEDTFRPPYGRTSQKVARHFVFAGTTNKTEYLQDETGNRRFWPIKCERVNIKKLREIRDQLLAEAVTAYKAGEGWYFEDETMQDLAAKYVDARVMIDHWEDELRIWFQQHPYECVTPQEVLFDALSQDHDSWTVPTQRRVASILTRLGWEQWQHAQGKGRLYRKGGTMPPREDVSASEARRQRAIAESKKDPAQRRYEEANKRSESHLKPVSP